MLNSTQKQKIKGFIADITMSNAVKGVLRETFLKNSGVNDVQTLAAERIAINLLEEGFKELRKYSFQTEKEEKDRVQVGL